MTEQKDSEHGNRLIKIIQSKKQRKKVCKRMNKVLGISGKISKDVSYM